MKFLKLLLASSIVCCTGLTIDRVPNPQIPTDRQKIELKKAGIPTVLPEYIPPGFRLTKFDSTLYPVEWSQDRIAGDYVAIYKDTNDCQVRIRGADWGWGEPEFINPVVVNTKLFGKVTLKENSNSITSKPSGSIALITSVVSEDGQPMGPLEAKGFPEAGYILNFNCPNTMFNPQEAIKILQSLEMVNP